MNYQKLATKLNKLSEPKYQEFNYKIVNTKQTLLGVKMPLLRKIAKNLSKDYKENLKIFKDNEDIYEMVLLEGLMLSYAKAPFETIQKDIECYVDKVDSWAQIDSVMLGFKTIPKEPDISLKIITKWLKSDKEFLVRSGLVGLLGFYVDELHLGQLFTLSQQIKHDGYYVMMANAWLISVCMAKFPKQTLEFFKNNRLDKRTHNIAIQKSIDSFRVSASNKEIIRKLRKR